ncbi:MAG TPA: hypothetical protein RMH26_12780, partial [Polyangiaceae bacterium LLY-WYZ-15_(1-7)]|nr:hypothetical protein [Polyangiaceae bacterium LLY-WYZ-15_(1-7)]
LRGGWLRGGRLHAGAEGREGEEREDETDHQTSWEAGNDRSSLRGPSFVGRAWREARALH